MLKIDLTAAVEPIAVQAVPRVTETVEASLSVVTVMLTATIVGETLINFCNKGLKTKQHTTAGIVPLQLNSLLSRLYPVLQEQLNFPSMLVQICSHPPLPERHSLTSVHRHT